jgi:transcriptional regulator with XRE-family HTH domain
VTLSERLRDRLIADGLTLGQLALRTGIPRTTISYWFRGGKPSADTMDRAFAYLVASGWTPAHKPCDASHSNHSKVVATGS